MPLHERHRNHTIAAAALVWAVCSSSALATVLDDIGITQFRIDTNNAIMGQGVVVAQPEASGTSFEVDASGDAGSIALTVPLTYVYNTYFTNGTTNNSITTTPIYNSAFYSWHAGAVAANLAGTTTGAAPDLSRILNFEADTYESNFVFPDRSLTIQSYSPKVVNQSYSDSTDDVFTAAVLDQFYDNYVAKRAYIIVTAAGNGGDIVVPGTAYNVITVGTYGGSASVSQPGQIDKPDLVAPNQYDESSFATAYVSGIAALMVQAAQVANFSDGWDPRVVKALLLNGATKPSDWTHTPADPLDHNYGAGIVNADASYWNLMAGEIRPTSTTLTAAVGGAHLPVSTGNVGPAGWNLGTISSSANADAVDHYVIDLSQDSAIMTLTATLTWQRANDQSLTSEYIAAANGAPFTNFTSSIYTINNLDLYLYNVTTQSLVDLSNSSSNNVQQLYTLNLTPGVYDLQVLKNGGSPGAPNVFSNSETYGFAWNVSNIATVANTNNLVFTQSTAVTISSPITGTGTLTQSGTGTTTLSAYQGVGKLIVSNGTLKLAATTGARQTSAVLVQASGVAITNNGGISVLDVTNNDLMITNTPYATIQTLVNNGMNQVTGHGSPTGPQITSTTAVALANSNYPTVLTAFEMDRTWGIGNYGDGSAIGFSDPGFTDGVTVTQPGTVMVKYGYFGDIAFTGSVSPIDLGNLLGNLGITTPGAADIGLSYVLGDLNGDGTVNPIDLGLMLGVLGAGSGGSFGNPLDVTSDSSVLAQFSGASLAPEPSTLALLALAGILLLRRPPRRPSPVATASPPHPAPQYAPRICPFTSR